MSKKSHVQKVLFQQKSHVQRKNLPMFKKFCSKKKNSPMSKKFVPIKIPCPIQKNFSCLTQKIHTTKKKFFHTHIQKNVHTHETSLTHPNKISAFIKNEFVQPSLHIKFSRLQYSQNSSQNTFNNTTNYIHCQISWVINIIQVTPCQIAQKFKNAPRPRLQHDNVSTPSSQENKKSTNFPTKKSKK